jgi:hypothetical protein
MPSSYSVPEQIPEQDLDKVAPAKNESLQEGVSLRQPIDTTYENTSEDYVDSPRSRGEAPVCVGVWKYPHRLI